MIAPSGPPLAVNLQEKTSHTLRLGWLPPAIESQNGVIRQYIVKITEEDTSTTVYHQSNTTQITIEDLHPYYVYKYSVAAETIGIGPFSMIGTVQLDEDSQ